MYETVSPLVRSAISFFSTSASVSVAESRRNIITIMSPVSRSTERAQFLTMRAKRLSTDRATAIVMTVNDHVTVERRRFSQERRITCSVRAKNDTRSTPCPSFHIVANPMGVRSARVITLPQPKMVLKNPRLFSRDPTRCFSYSTLRSSRDYALPQPR